MRPYTVIFYVDGDYSVQTYVEHVHADSAALAWDKAVEAARDRGIGRYLEHATEIITLLGHHEAAH